MATDSKRLTIDVPSRLHKKLKSVAGALGVSLRELVISCITQNIDDTTTLSHNLPNEETIKALKESRAGKGLVHYNSLEDLKNDLGLGN